MGFIKVKDIFKIKKGKKVDAVEQIGPIRYIQIDDLRNNNNIKYCNEEEKYIYCKEKDIVIAWDGANAGTVGYGLKGAIGSTLAVLSTENEAFDTEFCGLFLKSKFKYLRDKCTGATIPHISRRSLEELPILNLNIIEQKKIVKTINLAQELIDKRKEQIKALDELVKSKFIEMFGNIVNNTKLWEMKNLEEVCTKLTDGTHFSPESFSEGKYKYITAKNIKKSGFDFTNLTFVNEEVHKGIYARCSVEKGDVLYIKDGATTGIAMVNTLNEEFSLLSSVALLKQNRSIINEAYLVAVLNDNQMYDSIRNNMGGAAITRLTIAKLKVIKIPVPPMDLQNEFANFVEQVDKLKFKMEQSLKELEDNFNSLMKKAFKGELF